MAKKEYSLAHTKWMCKYHIVFTPKYRRKVIYNQYKADIRDIIKQLCSYKGVEIIEGHLMPDHIHMLVSIPPKISVSSFMGYLKGKSALMIFDRHANLKQMAIILGAKVTEICISDIEKVILSINKQFNSNHIELIIKTTENKKIKIVSKRYFRGEGLSNHAFINIFYDIKNANSELYFESDFDGTFLTLERKNRS